MIGQQRNRVAHAPQRIGVDPVSRDRRLGNRREEQAAKHRGRELLIIRLVREEVSFDVERKEIDASPAPGAAALRLPTLAQCELDRGDVVRAIDIFIEDEHVRLIVRLRAGEHVKLRLDDVPQTMDVEES